LIHARVRVDRLELNEVLFEVEEGFELPATVATIAGCVTINKLLFRERKQVSGGDLVSTFH
jgi:ABC-type transport system involved in Fe-S cluster assembly fused permease/ATPase subunit